MAVTSRQYRHRGHRRCSCRLDTVICCSSSVLARPGSDDWRTSEPCSRCTTWAGSSTADRRAPRCHSPPHLAAGLRTSSEAYSQTAAACSRYTARVPEIRTTFKRHGQGRTENEKGTLETKPPWIKSSIVVQESNISFKSCKSKRWNEWLDGWTAVVLLARR